MVDMQWPPAVVASTTLGVFGGIIIAAIIRYDSADEAMTVFAGLWGAFGAGVGLVFGYFFTRGPIEKAQAKAQDAMDTAKEAMHIAKEIENRR